MISGESLQLTPSSFSFNTSSLIYCNVTIDGSAIFWMHHTRQFKGGDLRSYTSLVAQKSCTTVSFLPFDMLLTTIILYKSSLTSNVSPKWRKTKGIVAGYLYQPIDSK
jgi:hypothetical protein